MSARAPVLMLLALVACAGAPAPAVVTMAPPADTTARAHEPEVPNALLERDLTAAGARLARTRACFACHTVDGSRGVGPTWLHLYGSTVELTGVRSVVADEVYLTRSIDEPPADVVDGFKTLMPSFRSLPADEKRALIAFIRSLR